MKKFFALLLIFTFVAVTAKEKDPFADELAEMAKERDEDGSFIYSDALLEALHFNIERKVIYVDKKIISYEIYVHAYTGGGHGGSNVTVGTIDRATGKELTLADIAPGEKLAELDRAIKDALIKQKQVKDYEELMTQLLEEPKPTENFYFGKDGLHFIYNEYEIACFADGVQDVVIQWKR